MNELSTCITTRVNNNLIIINKTDIYYCKGEGCYSRVYLENGKSYILSMPLYKIEELLSNSIFFRCHRSFIVNIMKITSVNISKNVVYQKSHQIPISVRKFHEFLYKCKHLDRSSEINWSL